MAVQSICSSYFHGFHEIFEAPTNDIKTNVVATLKIISYPTIIIPVCVGITYGLSTFLDRVQVSQSLSQHQEIMSRQSEEAWQRQLQLAKEVLPNYEPKHKDDEVTHVIKSQMLLNQIPSMTDLRKQWQDSIENQNSRPVEVQSVTKIIEKLYIGDYNNIGIASDQDPHGDQNRSEKAAKLRSYHIDTILICGINPIAQEEYLPGFNYIQFPLFDVDIEKQIEQIQPEIVDLIHEIRFDNKSILLCCDCIQSYSAFFASAYLMKIGYSSDEACRLLTYRCKSIKMDSFENVLLCQQDSVSRTF